MSEKKHFVNLVNTGLLTKILALVVIDAKKRGGTQLARLLKRRTQKGMLLIRFWGKRSLKMNN
jgi:hypothetical protein